MREAPDKLDKWPERLLYVSDPQNPRASKTIILSPYDSHASRTMRTEWVDAPEGKKKRTSGRKSKPKARKRGDKAVNSERKEPV